MTPDKADSSPAANRIRRNNSVEFSLGLYRHIETTRSHLGSNAQPKQKPIAMKHIIKTHIICMAALLSGCATTVTRVVPAGPNTYMVSASGQFYAFDLGPGRVKVYEAANQFCASKGLVMVPVTVNERAYGLGRHPATVALTFKALTAEEAKHAPPPTTISND